MANININDTDWLQNINKQNTINNYTMKNPTIIFAGILISILSFSCSDYKNAESTINEEDMTYLNLLPMIFKEENLLLLVKKKLLITLLMNIRELACNLLITEVIFKKYLWLK